MYVDTYVRTYIHTYIRTYVHSDDPARRRGVRRLGADAARRGGRQGGHLLTPGCRINIVFVARLAPPQFLILDRGKRFSDEKEQYSP